MFEDAVKHAEAIWQFIFEDAIKRAEFAWQFIHDYQPLIAGVLALSAAALTAYVLSRQGKNERIFRIKLHEIEMQNKRRAAAVLLAAEINSFATLFGNYGAEKLIVCAKTLEKNPDDQVPAIPALNRIEQPYLADHRALVDSMSMMASETVKEVSGFYIYAMETIDNLEMLNDMVRSEIVNNADRADSFRDSANAIENVVSKSALALPLLRKEIEESEEKLTDLKGKGLGSLKSYKKKKRCLNCWSKKSNKEK